MIYKPNKKQTTIEHRKAIESNQHQVIVVYD